MRGGTVTDPTLNLTAISMRWEEGEGEGSGRKQGQGRDRRGGGQLSTCAT